VTDLNGNNLPTCIAGGVISHCITHSSWIKFGVTAKPLSGSGTPSGDVAIFTSSPLQAQTAVESLTLSGGTATDNWNLLPGGSYSIYARYAGDTTYLPSVSSTPYAITIKPENCQMKVYGHNINVGTTSSIPYGTPVNITVEPYSAAATTNVAIPSGSINVTDNGGLITTLPINSEGAATFNSNLLGIGPHSIVLTFPGDASFNQCSTGAFLATVGKAPTTTSLNPSTADTTQGNITLTATVAPTPITVNGTTYPSNGTAPTGTVTFTTGGTTLGTATLVQGFDPSGNAIATATITVGPRGNNYTVTAKYNPAGTSNYLSSSGTASLSSSSGIFENGNSTTTFTITDANGVSSPGPYPASDSITLNVQVNTPGNAPNGNCFLFFCSSSPTVSIYANGILLASGLTVDSNGQLSYTVPQLNGYLDLSSGQVTFNVIYTGYRYQFFLTWAEIDASSATQTVTISDDRTSADFSLQSDTTVNQSKPLKASTGNTKTSYNLRLTSLYNFQSAYGATPITLSCSVVSYTNASGVRSIPSPMPVACGFNNTLTQTTASVTLGGSGYASQALWVGAASGFVVASNTAPAQPASRWWIASGGTTLACIFLLGLPARRRKWQSLLGVCLLMIAGFGMTGCGVTAAAGPNQQSYNSLNGGGTGSSGSQATTSGVPVGTYNVMVTATTTANTTITHTLPIQVLVGTIN
jgi:hypothetical protein